MADRTHTPDYRIGVDENGLGARLGPLLVTAVAAEVSPNGARWLRRKLPQRIAADLDDSKQLLAFGKHGLGEAWARALCPGACSPAELWELLSLESMEALQRPCPRNAFAQCWTLGNEEFSSETDVVDRLRRHLRHFEQRGVVVRAVASKAICVARLNELRQRGVNRFGADLHAMEELVLELRQKAGRDVVAILGKVGGITDYTKHFGPLSGRLHITLEQRRPRSSYRFVGVGELHFLQDADASDPLVMLASMVGKYLRELLMSRISRYYTSSIEGLADASGYHDPVTARLVQLTTKRRKSRRIPNRCFERASEG
jgi:ribonuclease HII